ncbi:MAG: response regulator, partial [Rhodospirillales bacterium]|nr:response regulator [Rhodospirillales bacterium]
MQKLSSAKILVVDDNPSNVLLLEKILSNASYEAVQSTTDPLAVAGLHQREKFDLILLDIQMPKLDGFGVMRCLKELQIEDYLPILVLTAQNDSETRSRALEQGAKDFVTKPFEVDEVLSRVANMLEVRLLYNQKRDQNEVLEEMVRYRTQKLRDTN